MNFTFDEIYKATGNFSAANIIGQGGFATVYKGRLMNGSLIAVKRFIKVILFNFLDEKLCSNRIAVLISTVFSCV